MFEKDIDMSKKIFRENKIPLLHTEPSWVKLFGDVKDKDIQNSKKDLNAKLSKERQIRLEIKKLEKQKQKSMDMILGVSDSVNNENKKENINLLDKYKNKIETINTDLENLIFQLEIMPKEIRETNATLLHATIKYGYKELKDKENFLNKSIEEINILKEKLIELINTKHDNEEWINETYTFFHGLLGSEIIEKIDKERLK